MVIGCWFVSGQDRHPFDMNGEQVLPEQKRFWRECAGLVVRSRDLGLVEVHDARDPDQRIAGCHPLLPSIAAASNSSLRYSTN
jgi:hypothetical protein